MDIRMPVMDGLGATAAIAGHPDLATKVIVLPTFDGDELVYDALASEASGYLLKDAPATELVTAIRVVAAGESILASAITTRLIRDVTRRRPAPADLESVARLSAREREVLTLVAMGLNNAEIAQRLSISEATVESHVARVLQKLGARDRVQAVVIANRAGLM